MLYKEISASCRNRRIYTPKPTDVQSRNERSYNQVPTWSPLRTIADDSNSSKLKCGDYESIGDIKKLTVLQ